MISNTIRDIRVKKNEFRDKTARSIAEALEASEESHGRSCKVERLDLSSNLINDSGGELLGLAIAVNENLNFFNLRKNNLRATSGAMFA